MTKQAPKQKGTDKKRKVRAAHSGKPRITQSKENRNCGPHDKRHDYTEWLKKYKPSVADPATIARYIHEPTEQELMLKAKYGLE